MNVRALQTLAFCLVASLASQWLPAQEGGVALQLKPAPFKARPTPTIVRDSNPADPSYEFKYKLAAGLTYPSEVTQQLSVQTTISGVKEDSVTNSVSGKSWHIESVDAEGNITLVHKVDSVKMSQRTSGKDAASYDSTQDKEIPGEYQSLEGTIGVPLTKVLMNAYGRISKREDLKPQTNPGIGDLTLSLPEEAIRVGDSWMVPDEVTVKVANTPTVIKLRYAYTLLSVSAGLATISYRTEVLSPISNDARVMSQLVGRMQKGEIKFDIDEGCPISRKSEINQTIVGFAGENSSMQYDMRATEEFGQGVAIVASLPEPTPAGPPPSGLLNSGKLLPGVSTGSDKPSQTPTPATPPPAQGEPTPAEPRGKVTLAQPDELLEHSVLVSQKSMLGR
jgi:hypothetical protein